MADQEKVEWLDDWQREDPLRPARGYFWALVISLGIYALAATVAVIIMAVNR